MTDLRPGRFQILPPIVKNLIIINVILVLAQFVGWSAFRLNLADILGLHYWRSPLFKPWQLLTHMFMHGDPRDIQETILHIFSNMFALWMFGSVLENTWGPKRFLTFYLICGLGAAVCHMSVLAIQYEPVYKAFEAFQHNATLDNFIGFLKQHYRPSPSVDIVNRLNALNINWSNDPGSITYANSAKSALYDYLFGVHHGILNTQQYGLFDEATVGASGAVFGVLFAYGYLFPNTELMLIFPPIPIKAKWFITFYALFELYAGIRNSAGDNVAHFAHLGGMLFAFLLLKIWSARRINRLY